MYFLIRKGKWDIPNYYGDGHNVGMNIVYLIMKQPYGVPFTLMQSFPFVQNKAVALAFPDMIIEP
jgi:glucose-1-phosphate thymidylyltransferase